MFLRFLTCFKFEENPLFNSKNSKNTDLNDFSAVKVCVKVLKWFSKSARDYLRHIKNENGYQSLSQELESLAAVDFQFRSPIGQP